MRLGAGLRVVRRGRGRRGDIAVGREVRKRMEFGRGEELRDDLLCRADEDSRGRIERGRRGAVRIVDDRDLEREFRDRPTDGGVEPSGRHLERARLVVRVAGGRPFHFGDVVVLQGKHDGQFHRIYLLKVTYLQGAPQGT